MSLHRWLVVIIAGVAAMAQPSVAAEVVGPEPFGQTADGTPVESYTLSAGGQRVKLITYGATLAEWHVPDGKGKTVDVVLGFDDIAGYESDANQSFGCTTGRVCNRIAKGKFTVDGEDYHLAINNEPNHLHGGPKRSLAKVVWKAVKSMTDRGPMVTFSYTSPDGEEGYPGTVEFTSSYTLTISRGLVMEWTAKTDAATPINLTNHTYFNLAGAGAASVLDHELRLFADRYTPVDDTLIPTGRIVTVIDTPLDFASAPYAIGERIAQVDGPPTQGYDHNFVLIDGLVEEGGLRHAAELRDPASGRTLDVYTTQPGVQFYTGNFLHGQKGKHGAEYARRSACCLETQHFPDSVNQRDFPSIILRPGDVYRQTCVYRITQ